MKRETISDTARKLRLEYQTTDPQKLCQYLDIYISPLPMGTGESCLKGLITRNSRCCTITLNSDLPQRTRDIVCFHELGHYALNHHRTHNVCAFQDCSVFNDANGLENEANLFVAEYLLDTDETIHTLRETGDFYHTAAMLHVPKEILSYKMRILKYYGLLKKECPIYVPSNCMGSIDCSGPENDDFA